MNKYILTFFTILLLLLCMSVTYAQQSAILGSWEGNLNIKSNTLRIRFHIEAVDTLYLTRMDSPDQGAFDLPTTRTSLCNDKLEITSTGLGLFYRGTIQEDSIVGIFNQGGIPFPLTLHKITKPLVIRPQTPKKPLPYSSRDHLIPTTHKGRVLGATLTMPDTAGTFPAILLIAGSGPHDRDETIFGHKPFFVISDYLTRLGFAVLRYDKRGVGKSTGIFRTATINDFVQDAEAALAFMKQQNGIDQNRIGLLGHSEGGIVTAILAAKNKDIHFAILMATPGTTGVEIVMDQNEISLQHQGVEPETIEKLQKINQETFGILLKWKGTTEENTTLRDQLSRFWDQLPLLVQLKTNKDVFMRNQLNTLKSSGYLSFLQSNPTIYLSKVTCPILAISGDNDTQVPAEKNIEAITTALQKAPNNCVTTKIYPQLNHLFQESINGYPDEYPLLEQTISQEVLNDLGNWLLEVTTQ